MQALQKGVTAMETDRMISRRFNAIEKEMMLQRQRVERRDGDLRQMLATLTNMASNQVMNASRSGTADQNEFPQWLKIWVIRFDFCQINNNRNREV